MFIRLRIANDVSALTCAYLRLLSARIVRVVEREGVFSTFSFPDLAKRLAIGVRLCYTVLEKTRDGVAVPARTRLLRTPFFAGAFLFFARYL